MQICNLFSRRNQWVLIKLSLQITIWGWGAAPSPVGSWSRVLCCTLVGYMLIDVVQLRKLQLPSAASALFIFQFPHARTDCADCISVQQLTCCAGSAAGHRLWREASVDHRLPTCLVISRRPHKKISHKQLGSCAELIPLFTANLSRRSSIQYKSAGWSALLVASAFNRLG